MYTCGQTVYNDIHIGNARFYVAFDAIRRYLEYKGYKVSFVQNFTDIDDKLIQRASDENTTVKVLADKYIARTLEDLESLGVAPATAYPRAMDEINEIIAMIGQLIKTGHAYEKNGSVYFNTTSTPDYGKLSRKNIDDLISGIRIEVSEEKQNPTDFILWKPAKPGEPAWESPWGSGRPGWHIECSAMVRKYLGEEIDIHGGGSDLIFPHHENEIAQSEAANNCNYARCWMHTGMITSNHKKMSKSQDNFQTVRELAQRFPYDLLRFYLVSGHYRMPMEFTDEVLTAAGQGLNRIKNCYRNLVHAEKTASRYAISEDALDQPGHTTYEKESKLRDEAIQDASRLDQASLYIKDFESAMDDDFNTPDAVTAIYELVTYINTTVETQPSPAQPLLQGLREKLEHLCGILGITLAQEVTGEDLDFDKEIEALIEARQAARAARNFAESDRIRDELAARGIIVEDTPQGPRWHKA